MFEQYSDRAMRVVSIARLKARQNGSLTLDVSHLLIGVLVEDQGGHLGKELAGIPVNGNHVTTCRSLTSKVNQPFFLSTTARRLFRKLEEQSVRRDSIPATACLPLSSAAKGILQTANWIKERFGHQEITPLHVLAAALLRDGSSATLFREAGIRAEDVLEVIRTRTQDSN